MKPELTENSTAKPSYKTKGKRKLKLSDKSQK